MTDAVPQQEEKVDFIKATLPRLAGGLHVLPMLKFIKFRELLHRLTKAMEEEGDPAERASMFLEIMEVVGVGGDEKTYGGVLVELIQANPRPPIMPWQKPDQGDKESHEDIVLESELLYEGRDLTEIVATLSSVFGWTADYILGILTYGEVVMYMQEALLIQFNDLNWQYMFSEVGFKKQGEDYVKVPLPQPNWMKSVKPVRRQTTFNVPDMFKPSGVVIDYTKNRDGAQYDVPETDESTSIRNSATPNDIRATNKGDRSIGEISPNSRSDDRSHRS